VAHLQPLDQSQADRQQDQTAGHAKGIKGDGKQIQQGLPPPAGRQQG
jgi:hypothetical protein